MLKGEYFTLDNKALYI